MTALFKLKQFKGEIMRVVYLLLCMLFSLITWANDSDLMLLSTYENQDIQGWVMSEKLDGVRGY